MVSWLTKVQQKHLQKTKGNNANMEAVKPCVLSLNCNTVNICYIYNLTNKVYIKLVHVINMGTVRNYVIPENSQVRGFRHRNRSLICIILNLQSPLHSVGLYR
jgi:hypothetical protein